MEIDTEGFTKAETFLFIALVGSNEQLLTQKAIDELRQQVLRLKDVELTLSPQKVNVVQVHWLALQRKYGVPKRRF